MAEMQIPLDLLQRLSVQDALARVTLGGFFARLGRKGLLGRLLRAGMPPVVALDVCYLCYPDAGHRFSLVRRDFGDADRKVLRAQNSDAILPDIVTHGVKAVAQHMSDTVALGQMPWIAAAFAFFRDFDPA